MKATSQDKTAPNVAEHGDTSELEAGTAQPESRSGYDAVPGSELPGAVYLSVFAAFAWIVVASWIAFAHGADADLALGMAGVLTVVFFALPLLVWLTARSHAPAPSEERGDFLSSSVETATGRLSGSSMWLQIALIPAALALAATLIGVTSMVVHS